MRVLISTLGSRGDVQPYLALALGLQRAGHRATLVTSHNFAAWIQSYGVNVHPVRFSVPEFMARPEAQAAIRSGNPLRQYRLMREVMVKAAEAQDDFWQAAQEADFVLQTGTGNGALEIAESRDIPVAFACPQRQPEHSPPFSCRFASPWALATTISRMRCCSGCCGAAWAGG